MVQKTLQTDDDNNMDEMRYTSFQEDINVNLGTYYQTVGVRVGSDLLSSRNVGS